MTEVATPESSMALSIFFMLRGNWRFSRGLRGAGSLFTNIPPKSELAFIVIQHLSPDYKRLMKEIL